MTFGNGAGGNGAGNNPFNFGGENPFRNLRPGGRKIGPLPITIMVLVVISVILVSLSGFYADLLWFRSVNFTKVWSTLLLTKIQLFIVFGLLTSLIVTLNVYIAYKRRPIYVPLAVEADNLERYRIQLEPIRRFALLGIGLALFYFAGSAGSRLWELWLLFRNSTPFGVKDPQFNQDISFFAFRLPFLQALVGWASSVYVLALIASAIVH